MAGTAGSPLSTPVNADAETAYDIWRQYFEIALQGTSSNGAYRKKKDFAMTGAITAASLIAQQSAALLAKKKKQLVKADDTDFGTWRKYFQIALQGTAGQFTATEAVTTASNIGDQIVALLPKKKKEFFGK